MSAEANAIQRAEYVCLASSPDLCIAVPSGGRVVTTDALPLPLVLKSVAANLLRPCPNLGICEERTKLRFRLTPNGTVLYSLNQAFCVNGYSATSRIALDVCSEPQATFNLTSFVIDPLSPARLFHPLTRRCLTVLRCRKNPIKNKGFRFFCDRFPTRPVPAVPPFVLGSVLGLLPCDASLVSQRFSIVRECSPGCAPFDIGNGRCDPSCNNDACSFDSRCRFLCFGDAECINRCAFTTYDCGTPSPTVPSFSPTFAPSRAPSSAPSGSPTTRVPSASPSVSPSGAPQSSAPTRAPTVSRPSASPSSAPSATPSTAPSRAPTMVRPSASPSIAPSKTPSRAPTSRPTAAPTNVTIVGAINTADSSNNLLWLLLLLLLIPCCCLLLLIAWCRRRSDRDEERPTDTNRGDDDVQAEVVESPPAATSGAASASGPEAQPTVPQKEPEPSTAVPLELSDPASAQVSSSSASVPPSVIKESSNTNTHINTNTNTNTNTLLPQDLPDGWAANIDEIKRVTANQSAKSGNLHFQNGKIVLDDRRKKMLTQQKQSIAMRYVGISADELKSRDAKARKILRSYNFSTNHMHALHELEDYVDRCDRIAALGVKPDPGCALEQLDIMIADLQMLKSKGVAVPHDYSFVQCHAAAQAEKSRRS